MSFRLILPLVAAVAAPAYAQSSAAKAADRFSLDAVAPPPSSDATPAASALRATFTLDTPIKALIANPAAKAVLDCDLPGLSDDSNLARFSDLGLRQFQPLTGGQLTDAMLVKVARDLAELSGPSLAPPVATTPAGDSRRDKDSSR